MIRRRPCENLQTRESLQGTALAGMGHRLREHRLADMDMAGMDMHIFSLTTPGCHVEERARGIDLARLVNDDFAEGIRLYPGRFQHLRSCSAVQRGRNNS
ncbi:MAG: hypothetical protein ACYC41_11950 [Bacillota bacterium]